MTDIENEKIIPPLKLMTRNEMINDLLKLLEQVQKMPISKDANIALTHSNLSLSTKIK